MIENELMLSQIEIFEKETEHTLEVKDGRPYYKGILFCISDYLPDNLVVDGGLFCNNSSKKLPKGLKVNGDLDISHSGITEIPDDCKFNSLNISHTKVAKLRDNLVLDNLWVYYTLLSELPKNLKVKGELNISNTKITEIPDDCECGVLDMCTTNITKLPDNLVLENLYTYNSPLTELPKGLKVKGTLSIANTNITEIPNDCEFGGLIAQESKLVKLRDNLKLDFLNVKNSALTELPKGLKVKKDLNISHTKITEIPDDCEFESLDISSTRITKLRDNLILKSLDIQNTQLEKLPQNLVVFNTLIIDETNITSLPNDCLVRYISCGIEFNDERYEKDIYGHYHLKDEIVHFSHPSGREFIHVDRILSEVIDKKGNVYHTRDGLDRFSYVVTDGNNHWAHGSTLEEAKQDLLFKISERDKSDYEKLTLDSELTFNEAVACYRVITGACKLGTQDYIENRLPEPKKEKYTIKEMIELTKNEYGSKAFQEFFETNITTKKMT